MRIFPFSYDERVTLTLLVIGNSTEAATDLETQLHTAPARLFS